MQTTQTQDTPAKLVTRVLQRAAIMAANMPARHSTGPKLIGSTKAVPLFTGGFPYSTGDVELLRGDYEIDALQAIDAPRLIASGSTRAFVMDSGSFYFPVCSVGRPS